MKRILFILAVSIALISCGSSEKNAGAQESATRFYEALKAGNVDAAVLEIEPGVFDDMEPVKKALNNNLALLGNLQSYEKSSGWNINTSTESGTTVYVLFKVEYAHGTSADSLTFHEGEDGQMRLIGYNWKFTQADYLDNIHASEEMATHYMEMVRDGHYDMAYGMVGYQGAAATDQTKWTQMLSSTSAAAGGIQEFSIDQNQSTVNIYGQEAEVPGNYYTVVINTVCANGSIRENLLFYQPDFGSDIKLVNHGRQVI
ncbi:MAG: hypothetical protein H6548_02860 [Chitinophagales bacterium]|nr:hypothetical protein [Chitinophagales bacterium]MCB9021035.1 hypothetical protein [Chitinophagales bacterium]HAE34507.1 hypothetical protein [Bacteroidota bacterium]HQU77336.1 hypothetical protein [Chitinophagales bacterium]